MDFFYNRPDRVVDEGIDALARTADVKHSDAASGIRVVVDARATTENVAVISGGGAGHEPAHAGFVGPGMLTAAVAGDIFTSPSVEAVLAAIRETCGPAGCLLIIKNYTGDRLNFGLAAERAAGEGYRVKSVIVADDISLPDNDQPRGLAGTVLVHKIAGYYAAAGAELDAVAEHARRASESLCSLALALSSATLPGHARNPRSAELGLGIHNEPGAREIDPENAADAMRQVLEPLTAVAGERFSGSTDWIVMLNDAGRCATQEISVLLNELLDQLPRVALLVRPAPLMTSLDMHGFSVTLLPAENAFVEALSSPVDMPAWPGVTVPHAIATFTPQISSAHAEAGARDVQRENTLRDLAATLTAARTELDDLDARIGDGDAGATFAAGAAAIVAAMDNERLSSGDDARMCHEIGDLLALHMGGSSGVLLSILFTAAGAALAAGRAWPAALAAGVARMQYYGGAKRGDRTLLDSLCPAIDALAAGEKMAAVARQARSGAEATRTMARAGAGRAAYVREDALQGVTDPGAEAIARVFERLAEQM